MTDQQLLDLLRSSLSSHLSHPLLQERLRVIKQYFYNRDFKSLFSSVDLCQAYACEYMPSRALCYKNVFSRFRKDLNNSDYIYCLGAGNGAELMGIAASDGFKGCNTIHIQDMTDYHLLSDLFQSLQDSNSHWNMGFENSIFDLSREPERMIEPISKASLITACFLLNEIITSSKSAFVKVIQTLISNMKNGAFLLVIDSAGSFSEANVGGKSIHMLFKFLDNLKDLEIVEQEDSTWYRFDKTLR